ncbi:chemotaxis protein R [Desulfosarcina ovata subsp. sediminis]|uniref:Chemotaxis protein R n=1 Tax=Desulfosarcina ovata subsp. sediminis TaxID=885957 RepID=A0A5K7ZMR7_9BACT|nr:protein-glutamate O-methyltransferase CheR [Desulfosarcina ovata]BBO82371.1 chemotaxis protein R [Desulfosarcina ovata subsp. sediminis]
MEPQPNQQSVIENIEIDLLLEALYRRWGYDFRSYARASMVRRIGQFMSATGFTQASAIIPKIIYDKALFSKLVGYFSVSVTEMFRDPFVYRELREKVIPLLRTWPHIKIWHAGCATGEEVYSLAILLKEAGIYHRATIYATDFNEEVLDKAREGVYEAGTMQEATRNYQQSDGKTSFAEYYHVRYDAACMDDSLKKNIVFAGHNLASDSVFAETHLVFCRNVMIYFNRELQNRAIGLFSESLVHGGFLCLGAKEDLRFTAAEKQYTIVDEKARIYRKSGN